ncbi:MAG TPA: nucleotidyltransferase family protein [Acidimicrobiia bacterium]
MTAEPLAGVVPALEAVAAYGLVGTRRELPTEPLTEPTWSAFLDAAAGERLVGLLALAILDGAFPATAGQIEAVANLETDVAVVALMLERLLLAVADRFGGAGIDFRVLKGPSVAHVDYPEAALRSFGDLDLLVRGADFAGAVAVLEADGGRRAVPELRRGFDHRFGKGATISMPGRLEVDLHRTFVAGPLGMMIDLDGLFETSTGFVLGDRLLVGLGTEERFLHACVHAALGRPTRLNSLRDIAQMALAGELDLARVYGLADSWRARAVLARAVSLAWTVLDISDSVALSAWAARYRPGPEDRRLLAAYIGGDRSYTRQAIATFRVIPRRRDKVAYARSLLFPERPYLEARNSRRLDHVRRGSTHLRWGIPR